MNQLSDVSSKYGAPMGRSNTHKHEFRNVPVTFEIIKLVWVDGDYDLGGAYWGGSKTENIYRALDGDNLIEMFVRASSIQDAELQILKEYRKATFVRLPDEVDESQELLWYSTGSGEIELCMTYEQAESMSHSGQCDADVAHGRQSTQLAEQLAKIEPATLRRELAEYGWEKDELGDHDTNLNRILWMAAGDIREYYCGECFKSKDECECS